MLVVKCFPCNSDVLWFMGEGIILLLDTTKNHLFYVATFFMSLIYSLTILFADNTSDHIVTIIFIFSLLMIFIREIMIVETRDDYVQGFLFYAASIHLGLALGFLFSDQTMSLVWLHDAQKEHLPNAFEVKNFLSTFDLNELKSPIIGNYRLTHLVVGVFFLLGTTPVMSILALTFLKFCAIYYLFLYVKESLGEKEAYVAVLVFIFSPSILFYSFTLYKDLSVQLLLSATLYYFHKTLISKRLFYSPLLLVSIILLSLERSYMLFSLVPLVLVVPFYLKGVDKVVRYLVVLVFIIFTFVGYREFVNIWTLGELVNYFKDYRVQYNSYSYMSDKYNKDLPYLLSFIKLYLTPFFTLEKFKLFFNFSILLTWGSFVHQATMMLFTIGAFHELKNNFKRGLINILPFFVFMVAFAYIASYSGRTRNSYYSIICMYTSYGLMNYIIPRIKNFRA